MQKDQDTTPDTELTVPTESTAPADLPVEQSAPEPTTSQVDITPASELAPNLGIEQEPQTSPDINQPNGFSGFAPIAGAQPTNKSKKKLIIGAVVAAAAVVLLAAGSGVAYALYQNPQKILTDSVVNVAGIREGTVKSTVKYTNKDSAFTLDLNVKGAEDLVNGTAKLGVDMPNENLNLELSADFAATLQGDGYLKMNNLQKVVNAAVDSLVDAQVKAYAEQGITMTPQQIAEMKKQALDTYNPIIQKIDNKWIKFPADKSDDETAKAQKCVSDTLKKFQSDKKMQGEIADAYDKNRFIVIKKDLGIKDGSYGFVIDIDTKIAKDFGKAVEATQFGKALDKCQNPDGDTKPQDDVADTEDPEPLKNTRIEVWVSQWSHQLTRIKVDVDTKDSSQTKIMTDVSIDYSKPEGLSVPKDSTDIKEITDSLYGNQSSSQYQSSALAAPLTGGNDLQSLPVLPQW